MTLIESWNGGVPMQAGDWAVVATHMSLNAAFVVFGLRAVLKAPR